MKVGLDDRDGPSQSQGEHEGQENSQKSELKVKEVSAGMKAEGGR